MDKFLIKNIEIQNPYTTKFQSDILVENGKITQIAQNIDIENVKIINGKNKIISFGLIDRHTHGGYGCNFNTCNAEELQNYLINLKRHGVVAVLPTLMTDSIENINKQIALIKNTKSQGAKILGIHLEGIFINPHKKGIHPEKYILAPTVENLNKLDTSFIKVLTYAPELDKNHIFLQELNNRGIIASIGHSNATYTQALDAINNGAKQFTHLFNALPQIHHREPSCTTAGLLNQDVYAEIICDLEHLHKAIIELILTTKPKEKILFISDSLPVSYTQQKEFVFGGEKVSYNGQKATSKDGVLAGSTLFLDDIYKKVSDFIKFEDFIGFASANIANSLKLKGFEKIEVGTDYENLHIWDLN